MYVMSDNINIHRGTVVVAYLQVILRCVSVEGEWIGWGVKDLSESGLV